MVRDAPWHAAFDWSLAAVLWFLYFARLPRRTARIGVCDLFYADPHSLRLALCLRRRARGRVRNLVDCCGIRLVWIFQAALLLGLLRTLVRGIVTRTLVTFPRSNSGATIPAVSALHETKTVAPYGHHERVRIGRAVFDLEGVS